MKPYLPLLAICTGLLPLNTAAKTRTMVVTTSSSEVKSIELSMQTRITFSKDLTEMNVTVDNETQTFDVDDIVNIVFTIDSTSDLAEQDFDGLTISHSAGIVTISATGDIEYSVWNMSGVKVAEGNGNQIATVDLSAMSPDVYIIKANNKTLKFIKH